MKAKRIFLAVLLTAALSVSCAAPAVLAESPAVPEVTTITVFRPNLGEEDYMGLQSVDGETLLPPAFASIEVVGKFAIVYSDETDSFYLYDWQKRAFVAEYPMMYTSGDYIVIAESWEDGNYGLLDQSGAVVTEMQWLWMGGVADDVVWVAADEDTMRVNLLHIPSGEMLLDEWADYCTEFSGGYSGFVRDGHVFFVDAEGNVQETSFVSVKESRIDGCFEVQTEDGVTGYYQPQRGGFMDLTIEDAPGAWNTLLEKRGRNLFVRKIHPTSEEVLAVADIAVRAYQRENRQYLPFLVQYDSEADVWLVYYAGFDEDGDMTLGGWNIAVDAKTCKCCASGATNKRGTAQIPRTQRFGGDSPI